MQILADSLRAISFEEDVCAGYTPARIRQRTEHLLNVSVNHRGTTQVYPGFLRVCRFLISFN